VVDDARGGNLGRLCRLPGALYVGPGGRFEYAAAAAILGQHAEAQATMGDFPPPPISPGDEKTGLLGDDQTKAKRGGRK
jgi:hypothetical protein